jgi:geranylgeranyl pyrophosphate synthase
MVRGSHDDTAAELPERAPDADVGPRWRAEIDADLDRWLPRPPACPPLVAEAMRYAVGSRGKRVRPLLALAAADAVAAAAGASHAERVVAVRRALPAACAAELIHTQSLVHDDLPAMDDDVLRRGQPTVHVQYGEGLAILAGDGLLAEAFGLLAREPGHAFDPPLAIRKLRVIDVFGAAVGPAGMAGGQAIDLAIAGTCRHGRRPPTSIETLTDMHRRKTGGLFRAAIAAGGLIAGGSEAQIQRLAAYGEGVGLAFQIVDDILDVEGTCTELGRTPGQDARAGKPTFPAVIGVQRSRRLAIETVADALAAIDAAGLATPHLLRPAQSILARLG